MGELILNETFREGTRSRPPHSAGQDTQKKSGKADPPDSDTFNLFGATCPINRGGFLFLAIHGGRKHTATSPGKSGNAYTSMDIPRR